MPCKNRGEREFPEDLIKSCIGIENTDHLTYDLTRALLRSGAANEKDELYNAVAVQPKLAHLLANEEPKNYSSTKIIQKVDIDLVLDQFTLQEDVGLVSGRNSGTLMSSHASIDSKNRGEREFPEDLIKSCIGIENTDHLTYDLTRALLRSGAANEKDELYNAVAVQPKL
ncbi:uncharacterized protein CXQ87_004606 [Candidozyma duobushaemuli]|uniref:Uncharacterized protein n=1 Tax=Candidozyma duobushaemuli TaxID=1231522 RepID=A0A2V1AFC4_9ASCO|nr:uncharacterized protein CXQ87_004606 [[Candida] duobushaemulonis]PVH17047.1 hypothetical protein CXQ87_004606 [[Candida] duobushaemulonis]